MYGSALLCYIISDYNDDKKEAIYAPFFLQQWGRKFHHGNLHTISWQRTKLFVIRGIVYAKRWLEISNSLRLLSPYYASNLNKSRIKN